MFADAHAQHAAACLAYAGRLAPAGLADDAKQEAFVKLARRLSAGEPMPDHPRAWLLTAVRSAALDLRRTDRRRERREAFAAQPDVESTTDPLHREAITTALDRLPDRQREVVVLHLWCDLTFAEAADLIGIAASTAHADYRAGLAALRQDLDPEPSR